MIQGSEMQANMTPVKEESMLLLCSSSGMTGARRVNAIEIITAIDMIAAISHESICSLTIKFMILFHLLNVRQIRFILN